MMSHPHPRQRHGFTLVELLVAMVIGLMVILIALGVLQSLGSQWRKEAALIHARAEARQAMDRMARDVTATLRQGGGEWLVLRPASAGSAGTLDSHELFFLSTTGEQAVDASGAKEDKGEARALAYSVKKTDPFQSGGADQRRGLFRMSVKPQDSYATALTPKDMMTEFWDAKAADIAKAENLVVEDIGALHCRAILQNLTTNTEIIAPGTSTVRADSLGVTVIPPIASTTKVNLRLKALEIVLVLPRTQGALLLRERSNLSTEEWEKYGDVFARRVSFDPTDP